MCLYSSEIGIIIGNICFIAGVNPEKVRGSRTGVFVGVSVSESHCAWSGQLDKMVGYEMTGCTGTMFANRLSYYFDFKGTVTFS